MAEPSEPQTETESVDKVHVKPTVAVGPDGRTRTVPERIARRVWVAAGARCTMCNRYLADEEVTGRDVMVGQLAHIVGWSTAPGSPRGSDPLPLDERNLAENLMLLCYDQHKVIDHRSMWEVFDADTLRAMKRKHEVRIRKLTGMGEERATTVVRVVGNLHGRPVDLTDNRVTNALLERDRFPDWTLRGADELEIDLRAVPGEETSTPGYWASAREHLEDRLGYLRTQVRKGQVAHLSIFALARIPVLIMLGTLLDETLPTDFYPKRRDGSEGWGGTPGSPQIDFTHTRRQPGSDPHRVAVLLSVSGSVDPGRLPPEVDDRYTLYELRPIEVIPTPTLIGNAATLDAFSQAWRRVLAEIEIDHRGAPCIDVFPAVPAAAAVSMGRHLMRVAQPPLRVFDRVDGHDTYQYAITTSPNDQDFR
ncbi:SAVED domain-containing protein [Amycolatopsis sp. cmx-4-61]|uniref:SAVED domain-containing protein n=1 Tax=Amycolatopsis sp. cmx-4-61 TaxID=2790937 RepID=UPI003979C860